MSHRLRFVAASIFLLIYLMPSAQSFSQSGLVNPLSYFSSKPKSVVEKSYFANVSTAQAIQYFKKIGMVQYSIENYDINTIRFRNKARTVFVMVFRESSKRVYIVMSREEYVDEIDA